MEDIAAPLYSAMDWSRCLVAGSYALQQYTQATTWQPNDIDVACSCDSHAEFLQLLNQFTAKLAPRAAVVTKIKLRTQTERDASVRNTTGREERYHGSILASAVVQVDHVTLPVNIVGFTPSTPTFGRLPLVDHLGHINDQPASVTYTVSPHGVRLFHLWPGVQDMLDTHQVPAFEICAARRAKYEKRGYEFV